MDGNPDVCEARLVWMKKAFSQIEWDSLGYGVNAIMNL